MLNQNWMSYIYQLTSYVHQQNKRIEELEMMLTNMQEQLTQIEEKNGNSKIERIEYHFDQLKIETLEGTLNIGLTPNAPGTLEEFSTGENETDLSPAIMKSYPNLMTEIKRRSEHFLNNHAPTIIHKVSQHYRMPIDQSLHTFIIQDIHNQLDDRIFSYLQRITPNQVETEGEKKIVQETVAAIQRDIEKGVEMFIQNHQQKGAQS
ncbi:spore germination protein GerPC [Bacillus tianshenii]|nr:spore germination protein GerPC [Bacillus tianshenii]